MSSSPDDWAGFSSGGEEQPTTFTKSSAVIDMSTVDDSSATSSFEDVHDELKEAKSSENQKIPAEAALLGGALSGGLGKVVVDQVWQSGSQQAKKILDIYGNIDLLRPYFDVEPNVLLQRVARSFVPVKSFSTPQKIPSELYGPLMTVLTLIAILLMSMKTSGTVLQQGTMMGTAFATCFGYWFGISGLMYFLAYICNAYITIVQCLSLLGYGMISHCIILAIGYFTHYGHTTFYILWGLIAGASAARIVTMLLSRTIAKSQRLLLCVIIAFFHMFFLLYLHFAYHHVVQGIMDATSSDEMKDLHLPKEVNLPEEVNSIAVN